MLSRVGSSSTGIKVLRLRLPKPQPDVRPTPEALILTIIRQLTYEMEEWLQAFETDAALVTIAREEKRFRKRTRDEVAAMLEHRESQIECNPAV